ncbi:Soluble hydrogenase 42 kDa subunit [compost metagenome]
MARMIRAGAQALGLRLVVENERYASMAVTGIYPPAGIAPGALRKTLQDRFGYVVAGGQGPLTDSIFRIGHCGYYDAADMLGMLAALEAALTAMGAKIPAGAGVAAAEAELAAREAVAH